MANEDLRDILVAAAASDSKNKAPAEHGASENTEGDDLMGDLSKELETLRGPTTAPQRTTAPHSQQSTGEGRFDEFSYQEHRAQTELSTLMAELNAMDSLIELDRMRLEELQVSMQQKIAARARLQHLHDASHQYLANLRGRQN